MKSTDINLACLLVLAQLILASVPSGLATDQNQAETHNLGEPTWTVHVINALSSNSLIAHCKSKDNDLGIRIFQVGSEFSWKFKINIIGTTLFWCYMSPDSNAHANLNVFWNSRKFVAKCSNYNCYWVGKDDGVYLRNFNTRIDEFVAAWQPGRLEEGKSY